MHRPPHPGTAGGIHGARRAQRRARVYTISSLYYDTADSLLIRRSLARPVYKEKLRLRAYGVPGPHDRVFLELKKKFRGRVNKRRTALRLSEACDFIASGRRPEIKGSMNRQVIDEIEYFLQVHDVEPRLYVAYDRRAYFSRTNPGLRITFDANIRTRAARPRPRAGRRGGAAARAGPAGDGDQDAGSLPLWLKWILSEYRAFGSGFSKYGREYLGMLANDRQAAGGAPCLRRFWARRPTSRTSRSRPRSWRSASPWPSASSSA